jgi:ubiquinone/menaquinone biosynthesis C-methylase UbiE
VSSSGSISFDRAAPYYDVTRTPDDANLQRVVDVLVTRVAGRGRVLEVGIGTGQVGLPLAARGVDLVGLDLSAAMLSQLRAKAGDDRRLPLIRSDAARMPFAEDSFGGAYARWVLHLIKAWRDVIAEIDRVVLPEGVIAIEPGGGSGVLGDVYGRFVEILGDRALLPGLDLTNRDAVLDEAMTRIGRVLVDVVSITYDPRTSIAEHLDRVPTKLYAWTWPIPDEGLRAAAIEVRTWAKARFDIDQPQPAVPTEWRLYARTS